MQTLTIFHSSAQIHSLQTNEGIDLLDTTLSSIVELLEEKGIVTQEEYEERIKKKRLVLFSL